jgi:hypothetical protein
MRPPRKQSDLTLLTQATGELKNLNASHPWEPIASSSANPGPKPKIAVKIGFICPFGRKNVAENLTVQGLSSFARKNKDLQISGSNRSKSVNL